MVPDTDTAASLRSVHAQLDRRFWVGWIAGIIGAAGLAALLIILSNYSASQNHQLQSAARSDCSREYQSILAGPQQVRDNLGNEVTSIGADLNSQLGTALLNSEIGIKPQASDVANYAATKAQLDAKSADLTTAIATVNEEPSLNKAVNEGFTWDGVKYPACPTVGG